jgi:hypothetical protein
VRKRRHGRRSGCTARPPLIARRQKPKWKRPRSAPGLLFVEGVTNAASPTAAISNLIRMKSPPCRHGTTRGRGSRCRASRAYENCWSIDRHCRAWNRSSGLPE